MFPQHGYGSGVNSFDWLLLARALEYRRQQSHKRLVQALANRYLYTDGMFVQADGIGGFFPQPPIICGYRSDICAVPFGRSFPIVVAEAETEDSLETDHTQDQWRALSRATMPPHSQFHVIVPEHCLMKAQYLAQSWGIIVDSWWTFQM